MIRGHWRAIALLTLIPVLANAIILSGALNCDPEIFFSGLGVAPQRPFTDACFVDPAVGFLTQSLGHLSAQDWLHGITPWWNPYTGIGMPLAAEVQNESFFLPFVLLLHFHNGWIVQRLLFEILTGLLTYAFLTELNLTAAAAILGGALFSLNGTFILTAGTVAAPFLFLPLLLIGIEQAHQAALANRRMGWSLIPLAVAGSFYAGFPEIAYFDGLLATCWTLLRLTQSPAPARWHLLGKTALGAVIGIALTAPLLIPFLQYLRLGDLGLHGSVMVEETSPVTATPLQMLPMFYGAIASYSPIASTWFKIGGWFGCAPVLLALYALAPYTGATHRAERYLFGFWALLWEARCFGLPGVIPLLNLIPGVSSTDLIRYAPLSVEFAVFVLAAFGLDDLSRLGPAPRGRLAWSAAAFLLCLGLSVIPAWHSLPGWYLAYPALRVPALVSLGGIMLTLAATAFSLRTGRHLRITQALIITGGILLFLTSQLGGLRSGHIDRTGIAYLKTNAGLTRFYTLGPFNLNYPAEYDIAAINAIQLPAPENWSNFYNTILLTPPQNFAYGSTLFMQTAAVRANIAAFEALGVKYLGAPPAGQRLTRILLTTPPPLIVPATTGARTNNYLQLQPGQSLTGTIAPQPWPAPAIYAAAITLGTFDGHSSGPLAITICAGNECATGQSDLTLATDNTAFTIRLAQPLPVRPGAAPTFRITHAAGPAVALWLSTSQTPMLGLQFSAPTEQPIRVLRGPAMQIYQLPNPAPYAQASIDACDLVILNRQFMQSNCPQPASLLRRELYYPGWQARVNGAPAAIQPAAGILQQIALPAGPATIRFSYLPSHTHLSCAVALLAALFWVLCGYLSIRLGIKGQNTHDPRPLAAPARPHPHRPARQRRHF